MGVVRIGGRVRRRRVERSQHPFGLLEHPRPVRFGDADDVGDHVHRQQEGDIVDEVALALLRGPIEDPMGAVGDVLLELGDHPRCEAGADQSAEPRVLRRVHRREHRGGVLVLALGDLDAVRRGERLPVALDLDDLRVPEHRPELHLAAPRMSHDRAMAPDRAVVA